MLLLAAAAFSLTACGEPAPTENVVQVAGGNADVSTLVSAVQAANLTETLSGEGPYTIFAPNNAAFEALPAGLVEALLRPENEQALTQILAFHVVEGDLAAADLLQAIEDGGGTATLTTLGGGTLSATAQNGVVMLTGAQGSTARVLTTDLDASNGVIHVIGSVLLPEGVDPNALLAQPDLVAVAAGNDQFGTLVTAVQQAGLVGTLQQPGPFTVFAPTNDAFGKLPAGTVETLLQDQNQQQLQGILTYHVVAGKVMAADLVQAINDNGGSYKITTVNGAQLTATLNGNSVVLTDAAGNTATVTATDVEASNGVIHVIDTVVLPG